MLPRIGTRKLHLKLATSGCLIGRDRLFRLLKEANLLIRPKRRFKRTTYSQHSYVVAPNRFKKAPPQAPKQALVCDCTYVALRRGFAYLFLVTDAFSRKILGFHLGRDLGAYSASLALEQAVRGLGNTAGIVHHSDRGSHYCNHEYRTLLQNYRMIASMTDESHCYQNAIAERVNGILKDEFDLDAVFDSFDTAKSALCCAVQRYNTLRPHSSLGLLTPHVAHDYYA